MHIKSFKLNKQESCLWILSVMILSISFIVTKSNPLYLAASIVGISALLYLAKGEPLGQMLTIVFSILYALVSYEFKYYGEMMTYLLMTLPSALMATIIWLKHPHEKTKTVVRVSSLTKKKFFILLLLTPIVTYLFYLLLKNLETPHLLISTLSITTSFIASMLTFFRSRFYALFYALNDLVLIALWVLATLYDLSFLPMVICFIIFFGFDLYGFINWKKLSITQNHHMRDFYLEE